MRSIRKGEARLTDCVKGRRENMKKQLEEINQLNQQNKRRKFYKSVDIMKRGFQPRMSGCKRERWEDDWRRQEDTGKNILQKC